MLELISGKPVRVMADRLAMAADEVYFRPVSTGVGDDTKHGFCENFSQEGIHIAEFGHISRFREADQFILYTRKKGVGLARQQLHNKPRG